MFEIVPEPAFRAWFQALSASSAEEVATALEVAAHAAETLDPPGVSRALLWFDGTGGGAGAIPGALELAFRRSAEGLRSVLAWQRELACCLDSRPLLRRLERLAEPSAAEALATLERLRRDLRAWQTELVLRVGTGHVSVGALDDRRASIQREFASVLGLLGFSPGQFIALANGLRELTVPSTELPSRVLFGVDVDAKRLVALLGESLDRAYYGDSVRRAEADWARYQERALRTAEAAL